LETLADRIERDGPLNALDAVGWVIRIAKHLESLHVHGVAHGGISLSAVVSEGPDRAAKGLMSDVRRITENASYHSPERVRGGNLSPADDTWALAVLLYNALTGQLPFSGDADALKQSILTGALTPLAVFDAGDDDLQKLVTVALERDISKRLSAVKQFREQLQRWHPDPSAKDLPRLDDEDEGDEDEARTVMHDNAVGIWDESTKSGDASDPMFAPVEDFGSSDDSDDDLPRQEEETVMRELPAHIMAMAARAAQGSNPPPAPAAEEDPRAKPSGAVNAGGPASGVPQLGNLPAPRPAAGAPMPAASPPSSQAFPGIPSPGIPPPTAAPVQGDLTAEFDDDDDDEARTMMRTSDPDEDDDEDGDEARTVMREAPVFSMPMPGQLPDPPKPPPPSSSGPVGAFPPPSSGFSAPDPAAALPPTALPPTRPQQPPAPGLGASAPDFAVPAGLQDVAPVSSPPTMALPSDGFAAIAAELAAPMPDKGPPPSSPDLFNAPLSANLGEPGRGATAPLAAYSGPPSSPSAGFGPPHASLPAGGPAAMSAPIAPGPYDTPPASGQFDEASPTSRKAVLIVSVLALVAAAAITYVVLRYRAELNLPFSVPTHAAPRLGEGS